MVVDLDIAAEQIKTLCDALRFCDTAIVDLLGRSQLDHTETQKLLDVRIVIWEATNK